MVDLADSQAPASICLPQRLLESLVPSVGVAFISLGFIKQSLKALQHGKKRHLNSIFRLYCDALLS